MLDSSRVTFLENLLLDIEHTASTAKLKIAAGAMVDADTYEAFRHIQIEASRHRKGQLHDDD